VSDIFHSLSGLMAA